MNGINAIIFVALIAISIANLYIGYKVGVWRGRRIERFLKG